MTTFEKLSSGLIAEATRWLLTSLKAWVVAIILSHTAINLLHGGAHVGENVLSLTLAQILFITIVVFIAPLVALFLLGRIRWLAWWGWWFFLSMLGSLLFGVWYHFVVPGADNIASLSSGVWKLPFQLSSILLTIIDAVGAIVGALFLYRVLHWPNERAKAALWAEADSAEGEADDRTATSFLFC